MVSFPKTQFLKNNNKIIQSKLSQYKHQKLDKTDASDSPLSRFYYYSSHPTKCTRRTLRRFTISPSIVCTSHQLITRQYGQIEFTDTPQKAWHLTPTSIKIIMHLCISRKECPKTSIIVTYQFTRKTCE